jgi:DNA-binding response OmpR family regulator
MNTQALPVAVVADPDLTSQRQIITLLERDFHCFAGNTLREAAQLIERVHPVLLVLELNQPDGDGLALIQYLQASPDSWPILIACVTTRSTLMDKVKAIRAGVDDYLVKPLDAKTFAGRMVMLRRLGHMARTYARR